MSANSGYGVHPTIYGKHTNEELVSLYRESSWSTMDENSRQQLLQETVNRAAAAKGELGACEVRFADLDSSTLGQQSGCVIEINRSVFAQDKYVHEYNGHVIEERAIDSNMRALETVLHEDIHAWQNQCIDGTIQCSDANLLAEYRSNNFTVSLVPDGNGGQTLGSHYLNGMADETGYYMYYFQSTERDAHLYSEKQTIDIMNSIQEKYGIDKSLLAYQKEVLLNGYQSTYQKGQEIFANPNFDKAINQVLSNQFYGTNVNVDKNIQAAVQKEMADSYQAQIRSSAEIKGEQNMCKNYTPVTIEDYDKSMRDSVNAFYEHAMNDPSMSREEAIAQTSQMAENYLNTMEELQEAHENGEIASVNDTEINSAEVETIAVGDYGEVETTGDLSYEETGTNEGIGDDGGVGDD